MRRFLIALVLAFALCPMGAASASGWDATAEASYQRALAYWGVTGVECGTLTREVVGDEELGPEVKGWATIGPAEECELKIVRVEGFPGPECDTMIHEVGHLLGHDHGEGGVMEQDRPSYVHECWIVQRQYELGERVRDQRQVCERTGKQACWAVARWLRWRLGALG